MRMRTRSGSFLRRACSDQNGQVLVWMAFLMTGFLGMAGLTVDVGQAYIVRTQIQNSTEAAGLAAAGYVRDGASIAAATAVANEFSANGLNPTTIGKNVSVSVTEVCLNSLNAEFNTTCAATNNVKNAIRVTETAQVNTFFMKLFGHPTLTVSATAVASMFGPPIPHNVAFILDATGSMSTADSNCAGVSRFECTLQSVQTLLTGVQPCPAGLTSCGPGTSFNANVRVSLWEFPNMMTSALPSMTGTTCGAVPISAYAPYTLPKATNTSYAPLTYTQGTGANQTQWTASYEITYGASDADANGFVSDWYDYSTSNLNINSSIVSAVGSGYTGGTVKTGCMPISPGGVALNGAVNNPAVGNNGAQTNTTIVNKTNVGEGITYLASVIYAAQAALTAEKAAYGGENSMIVITDGTANTQWIYFPYGTLKQTPSINTASPSTILSTEAAAGWSLTNSTPNTSAIVAYYISSPSAEATGTVSGLYPDFLDECQQSIMAAQYATNNGTTVYGIAYGAPSTGCTSKSMSHSDDYTDVTLVAAAQNGDPTFTLSSLNPCITVQNIASAPADFYSDSDQSGSGSTCEDPTHTQTTGLNPLAAALQQILQNWTTPRLLPNNAT